MAASALLGVLPGGNPEVGEVAFGAGSNPQRHAPLAWIELEIVDDEAGLLRAVHVEPRLAAVNLDLEPRPHSGLQVDVRLVFFRSLLARSREIEIRMGAVLRR